MRPHHRLKRDLSKQKRKSNLEINHVKPLHRIMAIQMLITENHIRECHTMIRDRAAFNRTTINGSMISILWLHMAQTQIPAQTIPAHQTMKTLINNVAKQRTIRHLNHAHALYALVFIQVSILFFSFIWMEILKKKQYQIECKNIFLKNKNDTKWNWMNQTVWYLKMYQICDNTCDLSIIQHRFAALCVKNHSHPIYIWSVITCRCMAVQLQFRVSQVPWQIHHNNYNPHSNHHNSNKLKRNNR